MEDNLKKTNPYKQLGKFHNEGLDFFIEHLKEPQNGSSQNDISIEEIIEIVSEYLLTIYKENARVELAINYELISKVLNTNNEITVKELLNEMDLSPETMDYIEQLDDLPLKEPEKALEIISKIENTILQSNLTDKDQKYPLIYISIAQSSIQYWQNEHKRSNSLWSRFIWNLKIFPWKSDAKGSVNGTINGTIMGTLGGLGGIAVGAALGAVGGAVGSSVKDVIFSSKNHNEEEHEDAEKKIKSLRKLASERPHWRIKDGKWESYSISE